MIHLQRDIKSIISKRLNDSSDEVDFNVSLYNADLPRTFKQRIESTNSYAVQYDPFISVVISDIDGDYIEVPNHTILNASIVINFEIPTSREHVDNVLLQRNTENVYKALDEFRRKHSTLPIPVGDTVWQMFEDEAILIEYDPEEETKRIDSFNMSLSFNDNVPETIVEGVEIDEGQFVIKKTKTEVEICDYDTKIASFDYEIGKYYDFHVNDYTSGMELYVNGENKNQGNKIRIPMSSTMVLYSFLGYIEYIGFRDTESEVYEELLINNFSTLENNVENDNYVITHSEGYGANEFGKKGLIMFGMGALTPISNQYPTGVDGINMQQFQLVMSATYGEDIFPGNFYRYFLDGEEVYPLSMTHSFAPEPDSTQTLGSKTSKTINRSNIIGNSLTFYHKNKRVLNNISKNYASINVEQNKIYKMEIYYPTFKEKYDVVVNEFSAAPVKNTMATFSISFLSKYDL